MSQTVEGEVVWLQDQELDWHREQGDIDVIFEEDSEPLSVWWHSSSAYILAEYENASTHSLVIYEIDVRDIQNVYSWDLGAYTLVTYAQQGSRLFAMEDDLVKELEEEF